MSSTTISHDSSSLLPQAVYRAETANCPDIDAIRQKLDSLLPEIVYRVKIQKYLGDLITKGHLQNLDSESKGPRKFKIGKRVAYLKEDFIEWFLARIVIGD